MIWQLLWKEGREHVWKMAAILALLVVPIVGIWWEWKGQEMALGFPMLLMGAIVLPGFVATGTVAGERGAGSLERLLALPVRPAVALAVKSAADLLTLLVPLVLSWWLIGCMASPGAQLGRFDWMVMLPVAIGIALGLYVWTLALAMGRRTEGQVAIVGVLVIAGFLMWTMVAVWLLRNTMQRPGRVQDWIFWMMVWPNPFAWTIIADNSVPGMAWAIGLTQGLLGVGLWALAAWRFGRMDRGMGRNAEVQELPSRIATVRLAGGQTKALLWKEWREMKWVAAGATAAALIVPVLFGLTPMSAGAPWQPTAMGTLELASFLGPMLACVVAITIGVGAICGDLDRRLAGFWMARPIGVARWFWTTYAMGLAAVLVTLLVPAGLTFLGSLLLTPWGRLHDGIVIVDPYKIKDIKNISCIMWLSGGGVLMVAVYSLAVFLGSVVRRVVYAGILASLGVLGAVLMPGNNRQPGSGILGVVLDGQGGGILLVALLAAVVLTLLAWLAVERDWYVR